MEEREGRLSFSRRKILREDNIRVVDSRLGNFIFPLLFIFLFFLLLNLDKRV